MIQYFVLIDALYFEMTSGLCANKDCKTVIFCIGHTNALERSGTSVNTNALERSGTSVNTESETLTPVVRFFDLS